MKKDYMVSYDLDSNPKEDIYSTLKEARQMAKKFSKEYGEAVIEKWDYVDKEAIINENFEIRYEDGKEILSKK